MDEALLSGYRSGHLKAGWRGRSAHRQEDREWAEQFYRELRVIPLPMTHHQCAVTPYSSRLIVVNCYALRSTKATVSAQIQVLANMI